MTEPGRLTPARKQSPSCPPVGLTGTGSHPNSRKSSNSDAPPTSGLLWDNRHAEVAPERVEQWLDEHADFAAEYFVRKASNEMVDAWMLAHGSDMMSDQLSPGGKQIGSRNDLDSGPCSGGNSTPVRKISAHEFHSVGSRPILATHSDGSQSFINVERPGTPTLGGPKSPWFPRRRSDIRHLDERELMHELVLDICNDLDVTSLCFKILQNVCLLLNADRCSLFLVEDDRRLGTRVLVSKLFDVTAEALPEESIQKCAEMEIRLPMGSGIMGHVGLTGTYLNIEDAYKDPRFNPEIDQKTGYKTRSILCMPLKDREEEVLGVAQAVNKTNASEEPFTAREVKVFESYLAFCGIGLRNAQLYRQSQLETRRNQVLLDLARIIFEEQSDLGKLISKIMLHTRGLLQCERCQVLLLDEIDLEKTGDPPREKSNEKLGIFSHAYDLCSSDFDEDDNYNREITDEHRFPINLGITGYVAKTGETVNIPDAYDDERFDKSVDADSNFRTRAILCMPIRDAVGHVVGVCQLINKPDLLAFTKSDENLFEAFGLFAGLGIANTQTYERAVRAMARQRVALEVLSYHAIAPAEEALRLKKMLIPSVRYYKLADFSFTDFSLSDDDTLKASLRMFMDLDFLSKFRISYSTLCRWLLSVKKNYRNVTYHNWRHAFNVAQTMFTIVKAGLGSAIGDLESLALIIACLCHDLDHRGTNNQFQVTTMSPVAELYSTSVLEHHHFDQCIMILNTKGNDILSQLYPDEYERVIQVVEQAILATDLARYFGRRNQFFALVGYNLANGNDSSAVCFDWSSEEHQELFRSMLMTACDVAAITKPWLVQKKIAELVASEFFEQGDIEKSELNITPTAMMDRDKKDQIPALQVGFIDSICMPLYKSLARISDTMTPLLDGCMDNRARWESLKENKPTKS